MACYSCCGIVGGVLIAWKPCNFTKMDVARGQFSRLRL